MQNHRPSLFRVISVDYASLLAVLFPVVFWVWSGYYFYSGDDSLQLFLTLSAIVSLVAIPFLFWRYRMISSIFEDGIETQGTVTATRFFRGRGRIEYAYSLQGQKFVSSNAVNRTQYTRELSEGQQVTVFMDRDNPKRAFLKEVYL
ncbi:MAG: DUF3592 domain-containing protein [Anaerolineales bacterium]